MKRVIASFLIAISSVSATYAETPSERLSGILTSTIGENVVVGNPAVKNVSINKSKKLVTITLNGDASYPVSYTHLTLPTTTRV